MQDGVERPAYLREQAEKCVRLANSLTDHEAAAALRNMAVKYLRIADRLGRGEDSDDEPNPLPPMGV